jgi:hypothetical protein
MQEILGIGTLSPSGRAIELGSRLEQLQRRSDFHFSEEQETK